MSNPWTSEFWRLAGLILLGLFVGLIFDEVVWALVATLAVYLIWHLQHLQRLNLWLQGKRAGMPDVSEGVWSNIYYHLYRLQKRNRKRKKSLAKMVNRFRESTNALPDAAVVMSANGAIENWNKMAGELLGLRNPQDTGQKITNFLRNPEFIAYFRSGEYDEPLRMNAPGNESLWLSMRLVEYGNNQLLLIVRDVTRLIRLEHMRKDFIANVSHELRTPLTVISGYLETLLEDEWEDDTRKIMGSLMQQTVRMQNIVTDLLLISKLETEEGEHRRQPMDVPAALEMIREDAEAFSMGKHTIKLEADSMLWLQASTEELISAFSNLVYNAVKYTPEGGEIDIRWYADDSGAWFEVSDNGIGIAPQHIPRLTERFYRVDVGRSRATGGTGLGLAIVKHVLKRHQATLAIDSELGVGSTFRCHFPASLMIDKQVA